MARLKGRAAQRARRRAAAAAAGTEPDPGTETDLGTETDAGGGGEVGARAGVESCGAVDLQAVRRKTPRRPDWRQPFSVRL